MSKRCVCGHEMTPHDWNHEWVCHRCGRKKPFPKNTSYIVFACRKCEHKLFVKETDELPQKLESVSEMGCAECGEQNEGQWILLGRSECSDYGTEV